MTRSRPVAASSTSCQDSPFYVGILGSIEGNMQAPWKMPWCLLLEPRAKAGKKLMAQTPEPCFERAPYHLIERI